jgi:hypothetical protein
MGNARDDLAVTVAKGRTGLKVPSLLSGCLIVRRVQMMYCTLYHTSVDL